ncbi:MAG: ATPase, T2SS/T4P/T4SS family [Candidatus Omnitrophota bacterium]
MGKIQKKLLGESLVEEGIITAEQLRQAKGEESRSGVRLRKLLVKMGFIDEYDLVAFLSEKFEVSRIELNNYLISPKVIELIPEDLARKYELIPILKIGGNLTCAMVDPWNIYALDELRLKTGFIIDPAVATEAEIHKALDEYYGAKGSLEDILKTLEEEKSKAKGKPGDSAKELAELSGEPLVMRLVNLIIAKAVSEGASDIHIEPEENSLRVRFRVDGLLHEAAKPAQYLQASIISRIKVMSNLDIAERRIPQDGRFNLKMEGKAIDVRVSCMPTVYGENVVLRLLDTSSAFRALNEMGFPEVMLKEYNKLIYRPYGIVLVTGPTGSGKTTTLYASLDKINAIEKNIITVEDPVEYKLPGIRQTMVNSKVNLTFASGMRAILRQDPDIIMVGEIRDTETAEIAIQAALTGHLVFSTLHTNDAASAVTRLIDMGIEPFLIASSVIGVIAQRLVRVICKECKGKGCPVCLEKGYKGRVGIYELLVPDEDIRQMMMKRASSEEIRIAALKKGMRSLRESGLEKVKAGITSEEEVLRVTQE